MERNQALAIFDGIQNLPDRYRRMVLAMVQDKAKDKRKQKVKKVKEVTKCGKYFTRDWNRTKVSSIWEASKKSLSKHEVDVMDKMGRGPLQVLILNGLTNRETIADSAWMSTYKTMIGIEGRPIRDRDVAISVHRKLRNLYLSELPSLCLSELPEGTRELCEQLDKISPHLDKIKNLELKIEQFNPRNIGLTGVGKGDTDNPRNIARFLTLVTLNSARLWSSVTFHEGKRALSLLLGLGPFLSMTKYEKHGLEWSLLVKRLVKWIWKSLQEPIYNQTENFETFLGNLLNEITQQERIVTATTADDTFLTRKPIPLSILDAQSDEESEEPDVPVTKKPSKNSKGNGEKTFRNEKEYHSWCKMSPEIEEAARQAGLDFKKVATSKSISLMDPNNRKSMKIPNPIYAVITKGGHSKRILCPHLQFSLGGRCSKPICHFGHDPAQVKFKTAAEWMDSNRNDVVEAVKKLGSGRKN